MYLFEKNDARYEGTFMTTFYKGADLNTGYFAYYTEDAETLAKHEIGLKFYPWYKTSSEIKKDIESHSAQLTSNSKIVLLQSPVVPYSIDGKAKESETVDAFNKKTDNGVRVKKFDDPDASGYCYRDIVLLDLSEMYLVMAEAYLLEGNTTECYNNLNVLRSRAGVANLTSAKKPSYLSKNVIENASGFSYNDLDVVLDERAREMYAQKTRWIDLRRTKQLIRYNVAYNEHLTDGANSMKGNDGNYKWYRPIPSAEISSNDAISNADQNDGYKTVSTAGSESATSDEK